MKNNKFIVALSIILAFLISITIIKIHEKRQKTIVLNSNIQMADEYFIKADYENAIEKYNEIIKMDNDNPFWYIKIAEIYSVDNDLNNSRKYLQQAKQKNYKDNAETFNYLIFTEFMNRDYDEALKDGEEALKKFPKNNKLTKTMFSIYIANKKIDSAKNLFKNYKLSENSAFDNAQYAGMLLTIGDTKQAYKRLEKAFNINMDEAKIYDVIAEESSYNFNGFLKEISELNKKFPNNKFYQMCLSKIYSLTSGTADMALNILNKVDANKDNIQIQILKLACYGNKKDYSNGDKIVNELLNKNKEDYKILHSISWYYLKKGDSKRAIDYCEKSIEKNKTYCDNYGYLMPEILNVLSDNKSAKSYFRKALYIEPYNYNVILSVANFYWHKGNDFDKALQYYNIAQIIKPNEADIKYNIALIYINQNKTKEAINILNQCVKIDASVSKYYRTLGAIYMVSGDYKNSIKNIRNAYNTDGTDILALNNAGIYYIVAEENVERGYYNLLQAYKGLRIKNDYDKGTIKAITENFKKVKNIYDIYIKAKSQSIKIPEFTLLY